MSKMSKDCMFFGFADKLTEEQKAFVDAMYSDKYDIVFCNSPAGTGKTTLAVATAKMLVSENRHKGLVFTFSPVEERKMGFRPGTQAEKEFEYTVPLRQALIEINEDPDRVIVNDFNMDNSKKGIAWVETMTDTFARGMNLRNCVVIIDESQNWTSSQLKKLLTRCHDSAKVIVLGHTGQCDLSDKSQSGFQQYIEHFKDEERAYVCNLTQNFRGWMAQHADTLEE